MQKLIDILNKTTEFFKKNGVPNPKLDAQYILAHGLNMKRMDLYLNFDRPLSEEELILLRPMVARRAKREPLQHIIGNTSFRGHEIQCDKRALIPRPETEMLVDMLKERISLDESLHLHIADIGTGSGAIAIALAKEISNVKVFASDISTDALELAKINAENNACLETLSFYEGSLLNALPQDAFPLHALVANLPYIPEKDKSSLQPEVCFAPELALFAGDDGLLLIRELLVQLKGKIVANAPILLEIASGQEIILEEEAKNYSHLEWVCSHKDYFGNVRFVEYRAK